MGGLLSLPADLPRVCEEKTDEASLARRYAARPSCDTFSSYILRRIVRSSLFRWRRSPPIICSLSPRVFSSPRNASVLRSLWTQHSDCSPVTRISADSSLIGERSLQMDVLISSHCCGFITFIAVIQRSNPCVDPRISVYSFLYRYPTHSSPRS
jgi:hypothetical protein